MTYRRTTLAALALGLALAGPAAAQEPQQEYSSADELMAAYMKAGTPGEAHALLARMSGTWDVEVKSWMDPSGQPEIVHGIAQISMGMDGRFSIEKVEGNFMGMPFQGTGVTGYNNVTGEFQSVWFDNMSTALYTYTGSADGDKITLTGEHKDPVTGEKVKQRSVLTLIGDNEMHVVNYETRGGVEARNMELHYKRQM